MTFRSRLPFHIYQKVFEVKDIYESITSKLEVIIDSTAILYSIRILIIAIALLMGYIHTPKEEGTLDTTQKKEMIDTSTFRSP